MPLALQLHLIMMSKFSKLVLIPYILFEQWATLKLLHDDDDDQINLTFSSNVQNSIIYLLALNHELSQISQAFNVII